MSRTQRHQAVSRYPRSARVNELLREVLATALEKVEDDDPRLELVTVTGVETDDDLRHATVYFSALGTSTPIEEVAEILEGYRVVLQKEIAHSSSMKHTPQLRFLPDMGIIEGERIDAVIRNLPPPADDTQSPNVNQQ